MQMLSNIPKKLYELKASNDFGASLAKKYPKRFGFGWVITPKGAGCHLLTEETQQGPFWLELARKSPGVLYQFHQDWVETLGRAAEKEAAKVGR